MRPLLILFFATFSFPVFAQGWWDSYENERFGFFIEVPPEFYGGGESVNGSGQTFYADDLSGKLTAGGWRFPVYGEYPGDFEQEVAESIDRDKQAGWNISYQSIRSPAASWSGTKGGRIIYRHKILSCDNNRTAHFRLEYERAHRGRYDLIIQRLVRTFELYEDKGDFDISIDVRNVNTSVRCDQSAQPKPQSRR